MTVHHTWTDRLSDYLDDDLSETERLALERHLAECLACRLTADELRAVRATARELPPTLPTRDLWPGISSKLLPRDVTPGRVSFSWPAALAAGLFIALASGLGTWAVLHRGEVVTNTAVASARPTVTATGEGQLERVALDPAAYDRAIQDLLTTLRTERRDLSPRTLETIERSLAAIDKAIRDARAPL